MDRIIRNTSVNSNYKKETDFKNYFKNSKFDGKCIRCGHPYSNNHMESCPAINVTYKLCSRVGHYSSVCWSKGPRRLNEIHTSSNTDLYLGKLSVEKFSWPICLFWM